VSTSDALAARAPRVAPPTVSVVISAYTDDRWDDLLDAIASVGRQTLAPLETVVVVDHNPALLDRVRATAPHVIAVANEGARGLSEARNTGTRQCTSEIVAFLDDDAVASPTWLERLVAGYDDPAVVGAGGGIDPVWLTGRPGFFPGEFNWVVGCSYIGLPAGTAQVRNLIGANMSYRREVISGVGGFRSESGRVGDRPFGNDDTEFCIRVQQRRGGGIMLYEPSARVGHKVPAGRATWSFFLSRCYIEGLSKAQLSRLVGSDDGLRSERAHTLRVLPRGVARGARDTVSGRDRHGILRSAAIVAGFACATAGYAVGRVRERRFVSSSR
jgi:glycosyltransferase involved in cell wall biosynthesis